MMTPLVPIISSTVGAVTDMASATLSQASSTASTPDVPGASFGDVLQQFVANSVQTLKDGEAAAISGVENKLPIHKVVDAVMSAERELQTVISLRDKAVNAYQEISRMAI